MTTTQVLVVDDDAMLGLVLADMLTEMGLCVCGVETTESGAISAALRLKPDLMIIDAELSPGSGIAAMAAIGLQASIPHVFMSGGRVTGAPPDAVTLLKPFGEDSLASAIQRVMRERASPEGTATAT